MYSCDKSFKEVLNYKKRVSGLHVRIAQEDEGQGSGYSVYLLGAKVVYYRLYFTI